jgi:signal transduction histidine kinase
MTKWLRGKRGGFIAFVAITALVAGGLGWVTGAALELEHEQLAARAKSELDERLRLALWRLDSFMIPELAREASRPFAHYSALYVPFPTMDQTGRRLPPGVFLEPSPLLTTDLPDWMLLHFSTAGDGDKNWWSPQVLSDTMRKTLGPVVPVNPTNDAKTVVLLKELSQNLRCDALLSCVRQQEANQFALPQGQSADEPTGKAAPPLSAQNPATKTQDEFQTRRGFNYQTQAPQMNNTINNNTYYGGLGQVGENLMPLLDKNKNPGQVVKSQGEPVATGPMTAFWINTDREHERLVVARQVRVGAKPACQGILLNWDALEKKLKSVVEDLFPDAELRPMRDTTPTSPERTMTALPVELVPAALEPPEPGWTPLRIGLALAWAAALIAMSAVGLGGWSLIDLSQRRVRFVSTVTHELRTPLTTLRLYLDMLTGGMVKDERQKDEYLHTLNAETDRLNRLVGNVLDFSRLENQHPRLEKTAVKTGDLLDQVAATWNCRCKECGKDLIVENAAGDEATLVTDVKMVQQVLGNLIDNACKYSRAATDARLWLRARIEGRALVFEVEDRGPGVCSSERRSIFRPFRRGKDADVTAGGVGLGLALAQRWAGLLGGKLTVCPGKESVGACFRLELPPGR